MNKYHLHFVYPFAIVYDSVFSGFGFKEPFLLINNSSRLGRKRRNTVVKKEKNIYTVDISELKDKVETSKTIHIHIYKKRKNYIQTATYTQT